MILGSQIGFCGPLCADGAEIYRTMSGVGIKSVDYSLMDGFRSELWKLTDSQLKSKMTEMRKIINDNGVIVGQTHSPMDADWRHYPESK